MSRFHKLFLFLGVAVALLAGASAVFAGPFDGPGGALDKLDGAVGTEKTGLVKDVEPLIGSVINAILGLVGTIFLLLTIYAGILWMTAQGNEEQTGKAQAIITTAVIGLFITMSAYAITYFVTSRVGSVADTPGGGGGGGGVDIQTCAQGGQANKGTGTCTDRNSCSSPIVILLTDDCKNDGNKICCVKK